MSSLSSCPGGRKRGEVETSQCDESPEGTSTLTRRRVLVSDNDTARHSRASCSDEGPRVRVGSLEAHTVA